MEQEFFLNEQSSYALSICHDMTVWNALVVESAQGHIFAKNSFLKSTGVEYKCYIISAKNAEIVGGVAIIQNGGQMVHAPSPFMPYQGIMFAKIISQMPHQKRRTAEFRITLFLIKSLLDIYPNISMALSPFFQDLRPFLWHNYDKRGMPKFDINFRYTAHLLLSDFEVNDYIKSIRSVRRQEYRKSQAIIKKSNDLELFLSLYEKTFTRQGIAVNDTVLKVVEGICAHAINEGYGYLSCALINGVVPSMSFFVFDEKCAYYLFGVNDPEMRSLNASSKLLINNIYHFALQGFERFDFVGVNSPQRGDFKLSFNADLIPYQEVHLSVKS